MKNKIFLGIIITVLLALDWAALHDIIKGNQPSYFAELIMLGISVVAFITIAFFGFRKTNRTLHT